MQNQYGWVRKGDVYGPSDTSHERTSWNWPIGMLLFGILIGGLGMFVGEPIVWGKISIGLILCAGAAGIYLAITTRRWESSSIHDDDLVTLTSLLKLADEFGMSLPRLPVTPEAITNGQLRHWANDASHALRQQYRKQLTSQAKQAEGSV